MTSTGAGKSKKRSSVTTANVPEHTPSKRAKIEGSAHKKEKMAKGKNKNEDEFRVVTATLTLSISPVFAENPRGGCEELLDSMIMRYLTKFTISSSHSAIDTSQPCKALF